MLNGMETLKQARLKSNLKQTSKWKKQWMEYLKILSDNLEDFHSSLKRALDSIKYSKKVDLKKPLIVIQKQTLSDKVNRARSGRSIKAYSDHLLINLQQRSW